MADELTTPRSRYRGLRRFGSVIKADSGVFKPDKSIIIGMDVDEMTIVCHLTWAPKKSHLQSVHTTIPNHIGGFEKLLKVVTENLPNELLVNERIIAVLESTASYSQPFIQYFKDNSKFIIYLINPGKQPKRSKSDNKTDDRDSIDIATKARINGFASFHPYRVKSEASLVMQMLGRRPGYYVNKRVSFIQSTQAELVYYGVTAHTSCSTKKDGTPGDSSSKSTRAGIWHSRAGLLVIEYLSNRCDEDGVLSDDDIYVCGEMLNFTPEDTRIHLMPFKNIPNIILHTLKEGVVHLREMDQQIKSLENLLMDTVECYYKREYEILSSCPGFGKIGPLIFIGETGEREYYLSKYSNVASALNNAGLGSVFEITGGKKKGAKKVLGNPRIKQVFYIAAASVIRNKSYTEDQERLKTWARSKWREKGWKQAVHILSRRLCTMVWHAYRTNNLVKVDGYTLREGSQKKKKAGINKVLDILKSEDMSGEYDVDNKQLMAGIIDMVGHNLGQKIRFAINTFDQMDKKCIGLPIKVALKSKLGRGESRIVTVLASSSIITMDQLNTMVMLGALSVIPQIGPKTIELLEKVLVDNNYIVEIGNRKQTERFTSAENGGVSSSSEPKVVLDESKLPY